ncbi:MFS general substrate transporter [Ophiobolus disseminans]|uniref:MFS general substrate transporter n=1 Tax=Ophiobolus disseminans TaxID=1469910 RepID=A0A6A6ZD02_9PLEO|nr:MFS general substrate transporter [Ophiobolus disseminans]
MESESQLKHSGGSSELSAAEKAVPGSPSIAPEEEETRKITGARWYLFVFSTLTSIFVYSLDNTIVANIIPVIVNDLKAVQDLPWLSVGFMIGGMATVLPYGKLYAIYDSRWVFIISTVVFLASSALCGAAPTMKAEIVGRVFAGAGGNGMYFGMLALLSIHTTSRERPQYLSSTGFVYGLGAVLGPVVGGGFALWNWRWGFYINLLFGAILLPTYFFVIPSANPQPGKTQKEKAAQFDWVGTVISVGAIVTLVMAVNLGGALYPWDSGSEIALIVVSALLWIAFAVQQVFCIMTNTQQRLFPVHLLKQKMPVLLFLTCVSGGAVTFPSINYIPIYFQFTRGDTAIYTALRILPFILLLITAMQMSGILMTRFGWYKPWYVLGTLSSLITAALMAHYVNLHTAVGVFYVIELFLGAGAGAYTQSSFAVIQACVPESESANGLALMLIAQLGGMALGSSVSGAVFINTAQRDLAKVIPGVPKEEIAQMIAGASNDLIASLSPEVRSAAFEAIVSSWQKVFICIYVAAIVGFIPSLLMKNGRANIKVSAGGG